MEADKLPFRDMRNAEGRLFAANAADVPALQPAEAPLELPVVLGSLTYPLAFTKVRATSLPLLGRVICLCNASGLRMPQIDAAHVCLSV